MATNLFNVTVQRDNSSSVRIVEYTQNVYVFRIRFVLAFVSTISINYILIYLLFQSSIIISF